MRKFTSEIGERRHKSPNGRRAVSQCDLVAEREGAVVQLVRIPACHAVGREFESRPHRKKESQTWLLFDFHQVTAYLHYPCTCLMCVSLDKLSRQREGVSLLHIHDVLQHLWSGQLFS